jgi:hypothetical protein
MTQKKKNKKVHFVAMDTQIESRRAPDCRLVLFNSVSNFSSIQIHIQPSFQSSPRHRCRVTSQLDTLSAFPYSAGV